MNDSRAELGVKDGAVGEPAFLFPAVRHPYYVVTPPYTRMSAGIKALHLLCHTLNRSGENAFIWLDPAPSNRDALSTNPDLLTPLLTDAIIAEHRRERRTPIVIYPETVRGNPLQAPVVVRYVLNYPGALGGDTSYPESEITIAYSAKLSKAAGVSADRVLFVPTSDTRTFHPGERQARSGSCFYAGKYRDVHGGSPTEVTRHSVEITRMREDSQTPEQIAELFRKSEVFYTYENTALAIEAMLCECPTVFLPNEHLKEVIAAEELGWDGFAWGNDPAEVQRAKATVARAHRNYLRTYDRYWQQLRMLVELTQERARQTPYDGAPIGPRRSAMLRSLRWFGAFRKPARLLRILFYLALLVAVAWIF